MAGKLASMGTKLVAKTATTATGLTRAAQPHLSKFWGLAKVELGPPSPAQWPEIKTGLSKLWNSALAGRFLDVTVSEGVRNTLIAVETGCWFYAGQVIGRKSLIGYKV